MDEEGDFADYLARPISSQNYLLTINFLLCQIAHFRQLTHLIFQFGSHTLFQPFRSLVWVADFVFEINVLRLDFHRFVFGWTLASDNFRLILKKLLLLDVHKVLTLFQLVS